MGNQISRRIGVSSWVGAKIGPIRAPVSSTITVIAAIRSHSGGSAARPGSDRTGAGRGAYTAGAWSDVLNERLTDPLPGSWPARSRLLHERVDDLLFAGLVEGHDQLVALDALHRPVAEFLVEDAVAALERPFGAAVAGGDQPAFALDDRGAGVAVLRRGAGAEA